jgi:hypothetical protein
MTTTQEVAKGLNPFEKRLRQVWQVVSSNWFLLINGIVQVFEAGTNLSHFDLFAPWRLLQLVIGLLSLTLPALAIARACVDWADHALKHADIWVKKVFN